VLPPSRISHTVHRQNLRFSRVSRVRRVRVKIRVSVGIRVRFRFSGANLQATSVSLAAPGRGNTVGFTDYHSGPGLTQERKS